MTNLEQIIEQRANDLVGSGRTIKLLEAGCGTDSYFRFNADVFLVGMDISREQLDCNEQLQEKILGDIQDFPLPEREFDVVVCWMVLEHLPRPEDALTNMFKTLKPGGILILGIPNLLSLKGIVTKFTPFWFHEMFYRYMRYSSLHFPTYLRTAIIPRRIVRYALCQGMKVQLCVLTEGNVSKRVRQRFRVADVMFSLMERLVRVGSLGRLQSPLLDACAMILQKDPDSCARPVSLIDSK